MGIPATVKLAVPAALGITGAMALQLRNMQKARASEDAERGRAALAGLSTLSDLSGLGSSLDSKEGEPFVQKGDWKMYTKSDGRVWYYNVGTGKMQWATPDEFK